MLRTWVTFACSLALFLSRVEAQVAIPNQDDQASILRTIYPGPAGCKVSTVVTYEALGRFWFPATIEVCQHGIRDITTGPNAPLPGERLFHVDSLAQIGSVYSLTRGFPNRPYDLSKSEFPMMDYAPYSDQPSSFAAMTVTLPFVPYAVYTYTLNGMTKYAYADLRVLPGREKQAYPEPQFGCASSGRRILRCAQCVDGNPALRQPRRSPLL